jgi:hypothetical protein
MEQYPCPAMNYPASPEAIKADCEEICRVTNSMQDRVIHLIFKKFNTLGGYIPENIRKIEG